MLLSAAPQPQMQHTCFPASHCCRLPKFVLQGLAHRGFLFAAQDASALFLRQKSYSQSQHSPVQAFLQSAAHGAVLSMLRYASVPW